MRIINLLLQSLPHLLPLFNELPLATLNKISASQGSQRGGKREAARGGGDGDEDRRFALGRCCLIYTGKRIAASLPETLWAALPPSKLLITTSDRAKCAPYKAKFQPKFDPGSAVLHNYFQRRNTAGGSEIVVFQLAGSSGDSSDIRLLPSDYFPWQPSRSELANKQ